MTVLHSGSNNKYSSNWGQAFAKGKGTGAKATPKKESKSTKKGGGKTGK